MRVKKLNEDSKLPEMAHPTDAGYDLFVYDYKISDENSGRVVIDTGIAMEIPDGHVGIIKERSSLGSLGYRVRGGVIDSGYRGEVKIVMELPFMGDLAMFQKGNKVAQIVVMPVYHGPVFEVKKLSVADRGGNGFGSTGR